MGGIFISYRREDSDLAVLTYAWLAEYFGRDQIFWDREDIQPGQDWAQVIEERVGSSNALVALLGPNWLTTTDEEGNRKLDRPGDWVRLEISTALRQMILVIPVLASGVKPPQATDLPSNLRNLARLQALDISDQRFRQLLIDSLRPHVQLPVAKTSAAVSDADDATKQRVGRLLRGQVHRLQVRAVELIQEGKLDRAFEELQEGSYLLMELFSLTPGEAPKLDVYLGYLYGTIGQAYARAGEQASANRYLDLAFNIFTRVSQDPASFAQDSTDVQIAASAMNGLAGFYYVNNELDTAIRYYRQVLTLYPAYSYAWHDMFGAYDQLARQGRIHVSEMRYALQRVRETGAGQPGLGRDKLSLLEHRLHHWEQIIIQHPELDADQHAAPGEPSG